MKIIPNVKKVFNIKKYLYTAYIPYLYNIVFVPLVKLSVSNTFNFTLIEFTKKVLLIPRDHKEAGWRSARLSPRHAYVTNGKHPKPSTRGRIGKQVSSRQWKWVFILNKYTFQKTTLKQEIKQNIFWKGLMFLLPFFKFGSLLK